MSSSRSLLTTALVASIVFVAAAAGGVFNQAQPAQLDPGQVRVVDGDTIRARGETYRLVGFNTPETDFPGCRAERALGERAKARLRALIASGGIDLQPVRCACRPGTEGTRRCNFGRACAVLKVRGRDVAEILIGEGLAEPYVCSATRCPPRRDWCER